MWRPRNLRRFTLPFAFITMAALCLTAPSLALPPDDPGAHDDPGVHDDPGATALVWTSGDWSKTPNAEPPYNGLKLMVTPTYQEDRTLASLAIKILDYTNSPEGATVSVEFRPVVPGKKVTVRPPLQQKPSATVNGTLELVSSPSVSAAYLYLFADLFYGLKKETHHAEGGILEIPRMGEPSIPPKPEDQKPDEQSLLESGNPRLEPDSGATSGLPRVLDPSADFAVGRH